MTATITETDILNELDFEPETGCECIAHDLDGSGKVRWWRIAKCCGRAPEKWCDGCKDHVLAAREPGSRRINSCRVCGAKEPIPNPWFPTGKWTICRFEPIDGST